MRFVPGILSILYLFFLLSLTRDHILVSIVDFPVSTLTWLLFAALAAVFGLLTLIQGVRRKTISTRSRKGFMWVAGVGILPACALWGAFGLGTLLAMMLFGLPPYIRRKSETDKQHGTGWMLFLQSVFISAHFWLP